MLKSPKIKKSLLFYILALIAIITLFGIDQFTKCSVRELLLENGYMIKITNFFDLVFSWNYGISFGMFSQYHAQSNYLFIILNSCIVLYIIWLLLKSTSLLSRGGYIALIAGAIGNIIDRIIHGAVFDFISFHYADIYFPAFNIADCCICGGAMLVVLAHHQDAKIVALRKKLEYDENTVKSPKNIACDLEILRQTQHDRKK